MQCTACLKHEFYVCQASNTTRLLLLQAIAEQYLPRIDNPGGMELVVEDAAGDKYSLRFRWVGAGSGLRLLPATLWCAAKARGKGT